ncbi:MAG: hypothetical protein RJQ00_01155 [Vicingaceae bacterium]
MYKKDQQKGIIALILFGAIGMSYLFFSEKVAKIAAVVGFAIWLIAMYVLNKKSDS